MLRADSPCGPLFNPCGLIGALPVGCSLPAPACQHYGRRMDDMYGLARNRVDGSFWYGRPFQPMTVPPSNPSTTICHIDAAGDSLGSFVKVRALGESLCGSP